MYHKNQVLVRMKGLFKQKKITLSNLLKSQFLRVQTLIPSIYVITKSLGKKCRLMNKSSSLASGQFLLLEHL